MKKTKIIILGGGFAGLYAAMYLDKKLARRPDVEATLISRENFFLFTPMLHEVAGGDLYPADIVNPIRRIIRHIKFVEAEVQAIVLSEFQTQESLGLLLGARAGESGFLGAAYERTGRGTLLFDEVEKAHPRIMDVFLQMPAHR